MIDRKEGRKEKREERRCIGNEELAHVIMEAEKSQSVECKMETDPGTLVV